MHPDLVATIVHQRMTTLVREARDRRVAREQRGRQMAKGMRPAA
jgi:hypothetical protein